MKFSKTTWLIIGLIIAIIGLLIVESTQNRQSVKTSISTERQQVTITGTNIPKEGVVETAQSIILTFDKPIGLASVRIDSTPYNELKTTLNPSRTELTIEPKEIWSFDTSYKLKIVRNPDVTEGPVLDKEYLYEFKTRGYSGI